ncbi:DNA polymerase II [Halobacteriovorax sp. HLS]|uniref:DNA polymerase II n=1 Tax=Halobacteriovorax sp. HLS TaxID=2234000 RepID=UPI000FDAFD5A|nr:DNA polymerase II [Halobacteriovorax sp. HLS]
MNDINGFILSSHYNDTRNGMELHFYVTTNIGPAKVVITDFRPVFFIETNSKHIDIPNMVERKTLQLKSFTGQQVDAIYFKNQGDLFSAKDTLANAGVRTYESDVRPTERYLMERFINGDISIEGQFHEQGKLKVFLNPNLKKGKSAVAPKVLSFDIETSMKDDLFSIGVHYFSNSAESKKVYMVADEDKVINQELTYYKSERDVLLAFKSDLLEEDPDFILGWHVVGFDLMFLEKKYMQYNIPFNFGRDGEKNRLVERKGIGFFATIPGRVVLDGPPVLRGAFYSFENFKLDTVASELLGIGKDINEGGANKVAEIERRFREDKLALAKYNLLDCTLVSDIFKKTELIELCITRSRISGMVIDRLGASTAAFDHLMLPLIHRKGFVAPNVLDIQREAQAAGGFVMEPKVGLFENIIVLDFKSLYPSIIKTFKIDPYSRIMSDESSVETPTGHRFSKTEHILPNFISELFLKREQAKQVGDSHLSMAIKILMNSFYGVMGSPGCRFYHADLPTAITGTGQWILKEAITYFDSHGYEVIYGDTDSVFVKLKHEDIFKVKEKAKELVRSSNEFLTKKLKTRFNVDSHLEIEFEKVFKKFFLPKARGSEGGAKKRYAGLITENSKEELYFAGMEVVRSDWTKVAKKFQYTLFEKLFSDGDLETYIKDFVNRLKNKEFDDQLIYRKRLTKSIDEYTKVIPAHVRAAIIYRDKTGKKQGKSIEYVMTMNGAYPAKLEYSNIDYDHYIEKQIRPLADSVLSNYDKSFDDLIIGDQLTLF